MGQPKAKWSPYDEDTKRIWTQKPPASCRKQAGT